MKLLGHASQVKDELQEANGSASKMYCCCKTDRETVGKLLKKQSWILALGAVGIFTAFSGVVNLQSSVNLEKSLGTTSLAIAFATAMILNVTLIPFLVEVCGVKSLLLASEFAFFLYTVANFHPVQFSLYIGAFFLGFGEALVWPVYNIFNSSFGSRYAKSFSGECQHCLLPPEVTTKTRVENLTWTKTQWFTGRFYGIFSLYQVFGNFIAFAVLTFDNKESNHESALTNITQSTDTCGAADCYMYANVASHNSTEVRLDVHNDWLKLALFGIYGLMQISALVIHLIYIRPVEFGKDPNERLKSTRQISISSLGLSVRSVFRQMLSPLQILLCPLSVCSGMVSGFIYSDFTRSFVSCPLGVEKVGLVMTGYGLSAIVGGFIFKWKSSAWGRNVFFVLFTVVQGFALTILSLWTASSYLWSVYIIAALLGSSESWRLSFLSATYPQYFQDNQPAAFSCLSFLTGVGYVITFLLGTNICIFSKIILHLVFLFVSSIFYVFAEIYFRTHDKRSVL